MSASDPHYRVLFEAAQQGDAAAIRRLGPSTFFHSPPSYRI